MKGQERQRQLQLENDQTAPQPYNRLILHRILHSTQRKRELAPQSILARPHHRVSLEGHILIRDTKNKLQCTLLTRAGAGFGRMCQEVPRRKNQNLLHNHHPQQQM